MGESEEEEEEESHLAQRARSPEYNSNNQFGFFTLYLREISFFKLTDRDRLCDDLLPHLLAPLAAVVVRGGDAVYNPSPRTDDDLKYIRYNDIVLFFSC